MAMCFDVSRLHRMPGLTLARRASTLRPLSLRSVFAVCSASCGSLTWCCAVK